MSCLQFVQIVKLIEVLAMRPLIVQLNISGNDVSEKVVCSIRVP